MIRISIAQAPLSSRMQPSVSTMINPVVVRQSGLKGAILNAYLSLVKGGLYVPETGVNVLHPGQLRELVNGFRSHADLAPLTTVSPCAQSLMEEQAQAYALAEKSAQDACAKFKPYDFQRTGIAWLKSRNNALLLDDMGLGKSMQALLAVPPGSPLLIICPSVAKGVWRRELCLWRPDFAIVQILEGRESFRWPLPGRVLITNKDILPDNVPEDGAEPGTVVIMDEIQDFKNHLSVRHLRAKALLQQPGVERRYGLTATPMPNRPIEMWNLLELFDLHVESFGTIGQFRHAFGKGTAYQNLSRVALRRKKTEVLKELPPKSRTFVEVDVKLSRTEQFIIEEAEEALWEYGARVPFELIAKARAITAKAKGPAAIERVEEFEASKTPLLVFSCHKEVVTRIGSRPGWALITGDIPNKARTDIEDAFQRGELLGVAGTMQAMGVSITLTRASHILVIDRFWNPAINEQAEDRANRIGQKNAVQIEVLVAAKTIDERVEEIISEKALLIAESIDKITDTPLTGF